MGRRGAAVGGGEGREGELQCLQCRGGPVWGGLCTSIPGIGVTSFGSVMVSKPLTWVTWGGGERYKAVLLC